ncbi:MAG TPA: sialidase family protein [Alphaproteobacteria bacterium]|nr:sialidase family protein [Alphaproteobacteria bacterium]
MSPVRCKTALILGLTLGGAAFSEPSSAFTTCTATQLESTPSKLPMEAEDPIVLGSHVYLTYVNARSLIFRYSADGGRHFTAQRLDDGNATYVSRPRIAASGNHVYIVWNNILNGAGQIMFRVSDDYGASFSPAVSLGASFPDDASQMGVYGIGVTVAFVDSERKLALVSSADGGKTWPYRRTASLGGFAREETAARRGNNIVAGWSELDGTGNFTYVATSTDGGASYSVKKLSPVSLVGRERQVAVSLTTGIWYIYAIDQSLRSTDGTSAPATANVAAGSSAPNDPQAVASQPDSNGEATGIVAPDDDDEPDYLDEIDAKTGQKRGSYGVLFTSTDKGMTWNEQTLSANSNNQWIVVDGAKVYLSWMEHISDDWHAKIIASFDNGVTWTRARDMSGRTGSPARLPDESLRTITSIHRGILSAAFVSHGNVVVRSTDDLRQSLSQPITLGPGSNPMIDGGHVLWLGPAIGQNQPVFYARCR